MTRRLLLPLFLLLFVTVAGAAVAADASLPEAPTLQPAEEAVDNAQAPAPSDDLPTALPAWRVDKLTGGSCFADCIDAYDICLWSCTIRGGACHDQCIDERTACLANCG